MIESIIECLKLDIKHNSEYIAIAKGKKKLPTTFKEALQPLRKLIWQTKL
jgi:hypothetical protein